MQKIIYPKYSRFFPKYLYL